MTLENRLANRKAIVTGGARGMGFAMAKRLHDEGAKVAVLDVNEAQAKEAAKELDGIGLYCDVSSVESCKTAVKAAAVSGALAAAMLGMLAIPTHIPLVVVIAGALIAGLGGGYYANKISVPQQNKSQFEKTVQEVIDKQESEVRRWADGLERYYDDQVGKLRKELEASANA